MECLTPVLFPSQHCQMSISSNSLPPKWTLSLISVPLALSCTPCWGLGLILVTPSLLLVIMLPTLVQTTNALSSVYSTTSVSYFHCPQLLTILNLILSYLISL